MIGNVIRGSNFRSCTAYLLAKPGAALIGGNMVGRDIESITEEFEFSLRLNPIVRYPLLHVSLSLPVGERLSTELWQKVADRYMSEMQLDDNQFIAVRHTDRPHDHIHLLATRIRFDGNSSNIWQCKRRTEECLRGIERDLGLQRVPSSWDTPYFERRNEKTNGSGCKAYICSNLEDALKQATSLHELREHLRLSGIDLREKKKDGVTVGLSYRHEGKAMTGSSLGKPYAVVVEKLNRNLRESIEDSGIPESLTIAPIEKDKTSQKWSRVR